MQNASTPLVLRGISSMATKAVLAVSARDFVDARRDVVEDGVAGAKRSKLPQ